MGRRKGGREGLKGGKEAKGGEKEGGKKEGRKSLYSSNKMALNESRRKKKK